MHWSNWKCRQTITASAADTYRSSILQDGNLVLGRSKGFIEVYRVEGSLKKRIEFRSHIPVFDCLRSAEISESIESLAVVPSGNRELLLITSNTKTMKQWSIKPSYIDSDESIGVVDCCSEGSSTSWDIDHHEKTKEDKEDREDKEDKTEEDASHKETDSPENEGQVRYDKFIDNTSDFYKNHPNHRNKDHKPDDILTEASQAPENQKERLRRLFRQEDKKRTTVTLEKEYSPENIYNIHSLSVSPSGESVLMADELSISLYNTKLEQGWKILNLKPQRTEELTKIITCAKYTANATGTFIYGCSNGVMEIHDLRMSTCPESILTFLPTNKNDFYSEVIHPISDIDFVSDNLVVARNLVSVLVYDIRSPSSCLQEHDVYPVVKKKIPELYDTDEIFAKFKVATVNDKVYTGTFNTAVIEVDTKTNTLTRAFLDDTFEQAERIVDNKRITSVSAQDNCLIACMANTCHIFRPDTHKTA
ncbi:serine/threonine-protein phosphatase 2A regulatory subunit B [Nematocida sp. AWRm80]|nr:serine/threonine-protein phosphatase 2A regulatory subunit B [Nematocida sp. AWRm80]